MQQANSPISIHFGERLVPNSIHRNEALRIKHKLSSRMHMEVLPFSSRVFPFFVFFALVFKLQLLSQS